MARIVNPTEGRAALHSALRGDTSATQVAIDARAQAVAAQVRMRELIEALAATDVTDIVSVGIGGSDLGPRVIVDALMLPGARFKVHFVSNVDGNAVQRVLAGLDPARTAAIVISKTFGTQETLLNGGIVRAWLGNDERVYAVSTNAERVAAFGVPPERTLPMWDWVGGRYSLWSAVGFPIALAIGMDRFLELLDGAAAMDAHAADAAPRENIAIWHALTAVWNRNALHAATQAVLPYDDRLKLLAGLPAATGDGEPGQVGAAVRRRRRRRHRAGLVGRRRHRHPAQFLPGAAPGHASGAGRFHRRAAGRSSACAEPRRAAGQPAGADRGAGERAGQR